MDELVQLWERPVGTEYLIAGWQQWADAGDVSSGLPRYLITEMAARMIGEIRSEDFYLFQIPGTHHLLRPVVKLHQGYREAMERRRNEFFCTGADHGHLLLFLGEEPHQNEERYARVFLDVVEQLGVKRVVALGGVHAPVPYDKDRDISCVYSLPSMKDELDGYAVRFSDYEGGATISTYLADKAEARGVEFLSFYAMVPAYDFSKSTLIAQQVALEQDFKAWHDVMRRLDHMFTLNMDMSDLAKRSSELLVEWRAKLEHLASAMPQLEVERYLEEIAEGFTEHRFLPYEALWEDALGDALNGT